MLKVDIKSIIIAMIAVFFSGSVAGAITTFLIVGG